jgi:hypothetical protein
VDRVRGQECPRHTNKIELHSTGSRRRLPFIFGGNVSFLNELLHGIAFIPALVNGIESLFGEKSGAEKKHAAMSFLASAMNMVDAVGSREIMDPEKFKAGMSMIIDGTVMCFRASTWAQGEGGAAPAGEGLKSGC